MVLYLEDLAVGDTTECSSFELTAADIKSFAEDYDPHPFHVDDDAAARTQFEGVIASGFHTLVAANRVVTDEFKTDVATVVGLGIDDLRWHEPVRPGDVLTPTVEIRDKRPRPDDEHGLVRFAVSVRNAEDTTVMSHVETALIETASDDRS